MKKIITYILIAFIQLSFANGIYSYELRVKNFNFVAQNILEFEIFVKGPAPQYYWMGQYVFNFNPAFANGGTLTYTIRNFSDLPPQLRPPFAGIFNNQLRLSPNLTPDISEAYSPFTLSTTGDGTKVIRVRLQTTACTFAGSLDLTWRNSSDGGFYTKFYEGDIELYNPEDPSLGHYYESLNNIANSASNFVDPLPPPIVFNVLVKPGCGQFLTLSDAFSAINTNSGGIYTNQNVTVDIVNSTTETSSAVLNSNVFNNCIVRPSNNSVSVTASNGIQDLIVLDGSDNVTIDGRVGGAGSIQLTLDGNDVAQSCIKLINGASNNNVKYINSIKALDKNIFLAETNSTGNDNNTFEYNVIEDGNRGISLTGSSDVNLDVLNTGNNVLFNEVKSVKEIGIHASRNTQNNTIEGNRIHDINVFTASVFYGISLRGTGTSNILRNKIYGIAGTNPNTAYIGISSIPVGNISFTVNTTINIINNFVSIVNDNSFYIYGIYLGSQNNLGYVKQTTSLNHNTFYLGKNTANTNTASIGIGMYITGQVGNECVYNQYNNLSVNEQTPFQAQLALEIYLEPGVTKNIDYNCYWALSSVARWHTTNYNNLTAYQTAAFPGEQNSIFKNANFTDKAAGDLHLTGASVSDFDLAGMTGTGVTTDIDLETRDVLFPYMGADESTLLSLNGGTTTLNLKCYQEGFYNSAADQMVESVPVEVSLRRSVSPYNSVSSVSMNLDANGNANSLSFNIPYPGTYYIVVKNWNMISTWNALPQNFTVGGTTNFDFSTAVNQAFGDNMNEVDNSPARWGTYGGDVNQDGFVNNTDVTDIHSASSTYSVGDIVTDLNGDEIIDVDDLVIVKNNESNFVGVIKP